jgi:hypothetical protein
MFKFKSLIALVAFALASCEPVYAVDNIGDKTFRFTDDEVAFCKANGGCTIVSNDEVAKVSQMVIILQHALEEAQKKLRAEQSKRCI